MHFTTASAVAHLPLEGVRICEIADDVPTIHVYLIWRQDDDDPAPAAEVSIRSWADRYRAIQAG
jgi:hypothetical protein